MLELERGSTRLPTLEKTPWKRLWTCLATGGREDEEGDVSRYWMTKEKEKMLEFERGSTRLHSLENILWKRLWTCLVTGPLALHRCSRESAI